MLSLIRNTFIRVTAFFEQILRGLIGGLRNLFAFLGNIFGLGKSSYYVEENTRGSSSSQSLPTIETSTARSLATPTATPTATPIMPKSIANSSSTRRPSGSEADYFRNMARQIKKN
jgi:hypothetical protein